MGCSPHTEPRSTPNCQPPGRQARLSLVEPIGKTLFFTGLALAAVGLLLWLGAGKERGGLLPGDISIERGGFRFYFPIVTCVVLSLLWTLLLRLFRK